MNLLTKFEHAFFKWMFMKINDAMWLRDSTTQVAPYLSLVKDDKKFNRPNLLDEKNGSLLTL